MYNYLNGWMMVFLSKLATRPLVALALLAVALPFTTTAFADDAGVQARTNVNHSGLYVGAEYLNLTSNRSKDELEAILREATPVTVQRLEEDTDGGTVYIGWGFNQYVGLELGYADLGSFESRIQVSGANLDDLADALERHHPAGGSGAFLRLHLNMPLTDEISWYVRPGVLRIEGSEVILRTTGSNSQTVRTSSQDDTVFWSSLGARWAFTPNISANLALHLIEVEQRTLSGWGLGLAYQF